MPLGPGPNLMMFVAPALGQTKRLEVSLRKGSGAPKMKPMMRPTAETV